MQKQEKKTYFKAPNSWTGELWKENEMPAHGYATYYLKVYVPSSQEKLALKIPPMGTASKLIINGTVLAEVGRVGKTEQQAEPAYKDIIVKVPDHKGELNIVFHISNFDYRKGGLWQAPALGFTDAVYQYKARKYQLEFFVFGSIFFMGFYHFGLFLFGFRNSLNIIFGSICLISAIRASSVGQYVIVDIFPSISWELLIRIEFISYFMFITITVFFIRGLFDKIFSKMAIKIITGVFIGLSFLTIFLPAKLSSYLIPFSQLATISSALYCFFVLSKEAHKKNLEAIIFMIGLSALTLALINDALFYSNIILSGSLFNFGLMLYFVTHSMILARRFSFAFFEVNRLTMKLQGSNATLEKKVLLRTERIENQKNELETKNKELQKLNVEKDGLISIIAHDLKAPFNRSKGLLNLLHSSGPLTKDQEEVINMIYKSTDQGFELISDLLLLYGENQLVQKKELINLNSLLKETTQAYKKLAAAKKIKLNVELERNTVMLNTDLGLFTRVLDNLLTNAIKFTDHGKNIFLKLSRDNAHICISVKDEGQGIPEEEHNLLFKRFQTLSPKPTGGEGSTGLGLSIVKQIMDELSGTVTVNSQSGKGSEFILKFPSW